MKKGFTLIEIVAAMVIIGILFLAIISIFVNLLPWSASTENFDRKTYLAQEKIEEYLAQGFSAAGSVEPAGFTRFPNYYYKVDATYVASEELNVGVAGPTDYKRIAVSVWGGGINNAFGTMEIVTLLTSYETQ